MAKEPMLYDYLLREPVVPVLVLILKESNSLGFDCAVFALACLSEIDKFRDFLVSRGCVTSIVNAILSGKVGSVQVAEEVCRCFCYISFSHHDAETVVTTGNMLLGLHALYRRGLLSKGAAEMVCIILRNLTSNSPVCPIVVEQDGVKLLRSLMQDYASTSPAMCKAVVLVMSNLGHEKQLHKSIIQQGMVDMLYTVAEYAEKERSDISDDDEEEIEELNIETTSTPGSRPQTKPSRTQSMSVSIPSEMINQHSSISNSHNRGILHQLQIHKKAFLSQTTMHNIICAIELISKSESCRLDIVEGQAIAIFSHLMNNIDDGGKFRMACSIANLASTKECRQKLVEQSAEELLIKLSRTPYVQTRTQCSVALGFLSEQTYVHRNTVASLLYLAYKTEEQGQGQSNTIESDVAKFDSSKLDHAIAPNGIQSTSVTSPGNPLTTTTGTKSVAAMIKEGLQRGSSDHEVDMDQFSVQNAKLRLRSRAQYDMNASRDSYEDYDEDSISSDILSGNANTLGTSYTPFGFTSSTENHHDHVEAHHHLPSVGIGHSKSAINLDEQSISSIETLQGALRAEHDIYPEYQYKMTLHATNQEFGGMAKKQRVDLPYPALSADSNYPESKDRMNQVFDVPVIMDTIPKDTSDFDLTVQLNSEPSCGMGMGLDGVEFGDGSHPHPLDDMGDESRGDGVVLKKKISLPDMNRKGRLRRKSAGNINNMSSNAIPKRATQIQQTQRYNPLTRQGSIEKISTLVNTSSKERSLANATTGAGVSSSSNVELLPKI
eukprot:CAMPEP_0182426386 /NCGR_PEP_ID=MMETSP1167-20130531/12868_1 /TAXON_ID=2988 /ORGANISM="Mallomonas Sp, Strain CCMP3275" /LENGTH=775 /DNA_ID=CAMNT_0024607763 /DNA_START=762 /DNA_END=3089 /DNA_ORIENTATION=+